MKWEISLKYWFTIIVVCLSLLITLIAGISSQVRWVSLLQRSVASIVLFGVAGYGLGMWLENQVHSLLDTPEVGQQLDVVSDQPGEDVEGFNSFTSESFERIHKNS